MSKILGPQMPVEVQIPLVYNNDVNASSMTNIMLIDSSVSEAQQFYDSANANTFPIMYSYSSEITELIDLLRQKFQQGIKRVAFVFHDPSVTKKAFLDNTVFFNDSDLETNQTTFSKNVIFLKDLVNEFKIEHYDFLACNTLQYTIWKQYYNLLHSLTNVKCGASNDKTGNIQYGADWIMENTNENVKNIYFSDSIDNYSSTLAATTISSNGGTIYIQYVSGTGLQYSNDQISWTSIGTDYPINIENTGGSTSNILTVSFATDLIIDNVSEYFVCASSYITFDGSRSGVPKGTVSISNVTNYPGLIQNGTNIISGFHTITVTNIQTGIIGTSYLASSCGWICQTSFAYNINNISGFDPLINYININNCSNSGVISFNNTGGICGSNFCTTGTGIISFCSNSGTITGNDSSGICSPFVGDSNGSVTISFCSNSGDGGGICGHSAGFNNGIVNISNCSNTGQILTDYDGGICGYSAGLNNGTVIISDCWNNGNAIAIYTGGICGLWAGNTNGTVTISKCWNTGNVTGLYAGGIAGGAFGYNTNQLCSITNSYSTGSISGSSAGGICGIVVGLNNTSGYSPIVQITNCYTLGSISTTCGGNLGGTDGSVYTITPNVTLTNCYSNGTVTDIGSGLISNDLPIKSSVTVTNCYIGDNAWSDSASNALLTGVPTDINTNNPGQTWTSTGTDTPYLLSAFNSAIYNPNSTILDFSSYNSASGLFAGYTYQIINTQITGTASTPTITAGTGVIAFSGLTNLSSVNCNVISYLGTTGLRYSYNINSYTYTYDTSSCYNEGTQILCENDKYVPIELLKKGDLVKTHLHGYKQIEFIGKRCMVNSASPLHSMHCMKKSDSNGLIDDLLITGGHSILVDDLGIYKEANEKMFGGFQKIDNKYLLLAAACSEFKKIENNEIYTYYHLVLENNDDKHERYGIWANGILSETTTKNHFIRHFL